MWQGLAPFPFTATYTWRQARHRKHSQERRGESCRSVCAWKLRGVGVGACSASGGCSKQFNPARSSSRVPSAVVGRWFVLFRAASVSRAGSNADVVPPQFGVRVCSAGGSCSWQFIPACSGSRVLSAVVARWFVLSRAASVGWACANAGVLASEMIVHAGTTASTV